MFKLSIAALAALLPLSIAAAESPTRTISVDHDTIEYRSSVDAKGILHLAGRNGAGQPFEFRVAPNGRLTGYVADYPVSTRVSRALRDRAVEGRTVVLADTTRPNTQGTD
jgi:hypothetical protein